MAWGSQGGGGSRFGADDAQMLRHHHHVLVSDLSPHERKTRPHTQTVEKVRNIEVAHNGRKQRSSAYALKLSKPSENAPNSSQNRCKPGSPQSRSRDGLSTQARGLRARLRSRFREAPGHRSAQRRRTSCV